jgi:hypothetical protein
MEEAEEGGLFSLTGTGQVIEDAEVQLAQSGATAPPVSAVDVLEKEPTIMPPPEVDDDPWNEFDVEPDSMSSSTRPNAPRMRDRYFGPEARALFFQRLQFLSKQRNKINWDKTQNIDELIFDNEDEQKLDFPFAGEKGHELVRDFSMHDTSRVDDLSTLTPDGSAIPGRRFRSSGGASLESKQTSDSKATFRSACEFFVSFRFFSPRLLELVCFCPLSTILLTL